MLSVHRRVTLIEIEDFGDCPAGRPGTW